MDSVSNPNATTQVPGPINYFGWDGLPSLVLLVYPSQCFQRYDSKIQVKSGLSSVWKPPPFIKNNKNIFAQHLTALQLWMMFPASYVVPHTPAITQSMGPFIRP